MQKKSVAFSVLLVFILPWLSAAAQEISATGTVAMEEAAITEIAAFEKSETEWMEIYNGSSTPLDLTGWKFFEDGTSHGLTAFRGDFVMDPFEYAVIANRADAVAAAYPGFAGTLFDSSWSSLKEEGEEIGLKDADGNFVEHFTYPPTGSSTSLERMDPGLSPGDYANWATHPASHSMGKARDAARAPMETGSSTADGDTGSSTPEVDTSADPEMTALSLQPPETPQPSDGIPLAAPNTETTVTAPQTPMNQPPNAVIQIQSGALVAEGETTINFDGRASADPDGDPLDFFWDFGDGARSASANPGFHKYQTPGIYTVSLTITDPLGASARAEQFVQVLSKASPAPTATKTPPLLTAISHGAIAPTPAVFPAALKPTAPNPIFPPGVLELRGYFVFEAPSAAAAKEISRAPKINAASIQKRKTPVPQKTGKAKTGVSRKPSYGNGDLSDAIRLTEIFPNPADPQDEWIEIFNAGGAAVNLGNWMLADEKKVASPYLIPDSLTLKPGAYAAFQKSATRINLNNEGDTVFLADFEGAVVDSVSYNASKKGFAYARIGADEDDGSWQWVDTPTRGAGSPSFATIEGSVQAVSGDDGTLSVALADGDSKIIHFSPKNLDPLFSEALLKEETEVRLKATPQSDGTYALASIDGVRGPSKPAQDDAPKKSSPLWWTAFGALAMGLFLKKTALMDALKKWRAWHTRLRPETAGFQTNETPKPET